MKQILIIFLTLISIASYAQNITRDNSGNYVQVKSTVRQDTVLQKEKYINSKGEAFPVYMTHKGKFYVPTISKNGRYYRKYLKIEA